MASTLAALQRASMDSTRIDLGWRRTDDGDRVADMRWVPRIHALVLGSSVLSGAAPLLLACGPATPPLATEGTSSGDGPSTTTTTPTTAAPATTTGAPDDTTGAPASSSGPPSTTDGTTMGPHVFFDVGKVPDMPNSDDTTTGPPVDCDSIPRGPFPYSVKTNIIATEDLAFDDQGNLVGADFGNLFRTQYDENPQLWVPGAGVSAGLRATSEGMIVFNGPDNLSRINEFDAPEIILGGLSYPNGMDVDLDGYVYVAEQSGSRVRRIDSETGEFTIVAEGLSAPNGVSFSPDYQTLYVGSFGGGTITAIHLNPDMTTDSVELFYGGIGGGALDGMAVDACGNVYVCEYVAAIVWRIPPDASTIEPVVYLGGETGWIPNMQFGSGYGGWDTHTLYVLDFAAGRVFEVPVGVPDKPRGYP
jgi:sugar lactone lactonase YvrE